MTPQCYGPLSGSIKNAWTAFLSRMGLDADPCVESTVLIWEDDRIIAAGSRQKNVLKCIAVDPMHQGDGLTATLLTHLRQDAFSAGFKHLFLYTKPQNLMQFSSLFFYPIAKTDQVLLMENIRGGLEQHLMQLDAPKKTGEIGAIVMHCNPFTLGHRYLIETAAAKCDHLYLFILSEEQSIFPAADRLKLVKEGTSDLPNVTVNPTGQYLISSATFPSYFIKDKGLVSDAHCELDIEVFTKYFVPHFGITHRFVGTEPTCSVTANYNKKLKDLLPKAGITVSEIPRLETGGQPISASTVRSLLNTNQPDRIQKLVPETTFAYLTEHNYI